MFPSLPAYKNGESRIIKLNTCKFYHHDLSHHEQILDNKEWCIKTASPCPEALLRYLPVKERGRFKENTDSYGPFRHTVHYPVHAYDIKCCSGGYIRVIQLGSNARIFSNRGGDSI